MNKVIIIAFFDVENYAPLIDLLVTETPTFSFASSISRSHKGTSIESFLFCEAQNVSKETATELVWLLSIHRPILVIC